MKKVKVLVLILCEYILMTVGIALALTGAKGGIIAAGLFLLALAFPFEVFKLKEGGELEGKETLAQYIPFALYIFAFVGVKTHMFDNTVVLGIVGLAGIIAVIGELVVRSKKAK